MIGSAPGVPLVLAPCNDLLGLFIAEGIEDALTARCGAGFGAWAAGSGQVGQKELDATGGPGTEAGTTVGG